MQIQTKFISSWSYTDIHISLFSISLRSALVGKNWRLPVANRREMIVGSEPAVVCNPLQSKSSIAISYNFSNLARRCGLLTSCHPGTFCRNHDCNSRLPQRLGSVESVFRTKCFKVIEELPGEPKTSAKPGADSLGCLRNRWTLGMVCPHSHLYPVASVISVYLEA